MYYFSNLEFDIKYKAKDFVKQLPSEDYDKFILAYSTIESTDLVLLQEDEQKALAEYIFKTINLQDENTLINLINKNIHQINTDLKSLAIHLLSQSNYSIADMYEWDYKKIFYVLFLEIAKNEKIRDLFVEFAPKYFPEERQAAISKHLKNVFPKQETTETNSIVDNSSSDNNNQELIDALNRL